MVSKLNLASNRLSSVMPTELGILLDRCLLETDHDCSEFQFEANRLCPILPTELGATAGTVDTTGRFKGTHKWATKPNPLDACSASVSTARDSASVELSVQQITGSIPTQVLKFIKLLRQLLYQLL